VVREGRLWISEVDPTPVEAVPVTVETTHAFSLNRVSTPRVFLPGGSREAVALVRNDGPDAWPGDGSVALAYHWFAADGEVVEWEGRRAVINRPVAPGGAVELSLRVEAPPTIGRLTLQWDMVEEGVCWFSERDPSPEPPLVVVVFPTVSVTPWLWSILVAAAAAAAVTVVNRGWGPLRTRGWAMADVLWCVTVVVVKQAWVLGGVGVGLSAAGWSLICATAALVGLVLLGLPSRVRPLLSWATGVVVTVVLYADLIHHRFFGDLLSVAALASAGQIGRVESSVRSLVEPGDLWFFADLAPALLLVWVGIRSVGRSPRRKGVAVALASAAVGFGILGVILVRGAQVSFRQIFHSTQLARHVGVLNLHVADAVRADLSRADLLEVVEFFDDRRHTRAGSGPLFGAARGSNLVMIQAESLQAFVVGFQVGGREVTPYLNSLAARHMLFANVTDQTEEGRSSDSELATQVSLLPPDRGAAAFLHAGNSYTGLASILTERGYRTISAVPFDGSFWNRRTTHEAYGFARSLFVDDFESGEKIGWGLSDREFLAQSASLLAELPEPWCAYLLTLSLHHPFEGFPDHLKVLDVGRWEGSPLGNFLHTVHHFDRALAAFVSELDARGVADRTVIAVWGDHDAGFEWTSEMASAMGVSHDAAGWYLSQRVPLLIRAPGVEPEASVLDRPAGHVDVAPTLLALLGVDPAPYAFTGRNLLGSPGTAPVVGEYRCWRDEVHLYLRRGPGLSDGECIELATMRPVAPEACAAGFDAARREVEISRLVLEHDLQKKLGKSLAEQP
jgi:phosphoglycerol transferase MdoB-like AlkP superfamily enzyme